MFLGAVSLFTGCKSKMSEYDEKGYQDGGFVIDPATVREIEIEWIDGNVNLLAEGDSIQASEEDHNKKKVCFRYRLQEGVLSIKYAPSKAALQGESKDLTLTFPANKTFEKVTVSLTSGNVSARTLYAEALSVKVESGKTSLTTCSGKELDIAAASGNVFLTQTNFLNLCCTCGAGTFSAVTLTAQSAEITARAGNIVTADLNCASLTVTSNAGNVTLGLSEKVKGYTLTPTVTSGEIIAQKATKNKDAYEYGDKSTAIFATLANGNLAVILP